MPGVETETTHVIKVAPSSLISAHNGYLCDHFELVMKYKGHDVTDNNTHEYHLKPIYVMNDRFHREDERLKTYEKWPLDWMDKHQLARTGMFYTGDCDKVKCYFCEVEIGRWEREDEPVGEHIKWSPNCPLLRRRTTNNVPISPEAVEQLLPPVSYDICGANDAVNDVVRPLSYAEGVIPTTHMLPQEQNAINATMTSAITSASSGNQAYFPEYPEYAIEAARIRSFSEWPRHMKQKPHQLAEAGFFYTGVGDRVKCFSCGGGLKDWFDGDDPWEQHALWLSKCRFLKLVKGESYIENVLAQQKENEADEQRECPPEENHTTAQVTDKITLNIDTLATGAAKVINAQNTVGTRRTAENLLSGGNSSSDPGSVNFESTTNQVYTQQQQAQQNCLVAPQTAALRIYDKIIAETTKSSNATHTNVSTTMSTPLFTDNLEKKSHATGIPEEKLCKICYAAEYNTAFLPCGHVVACAKCASSVTKCPLCRKLFTDVMRVYFS